VEQQYLRAFNVPVDARIKALSTGTRTKLAVLLALARGAELLILDEPTAGLDPAAAEEVLQLLVSDVAARGTTVLFSTHQIADVDQIADRIVIIDRGRHVVSGGIDDVRSAYRRIHIVFDGDAPAVTWRSPGVAHARRQGRVLSVLSAGSTEALLAEARALDPSSIEVLPVTLKELFLDVTGGSQ
jgi:ABC-2 type transport system ATP-binding protein